MISPIPNHKKLVIFDGVCNLCNNAVKHIIKYDKKNKFMFTALQSSAGRLFIKRLNIDTTKIDSIILYTPQKNITYKSNAVIKIAYNLGFPHNIMVIFLIMCLFQ